MSIVTPGQLGLNLDANMVNNGLNKDDISAFVYDFSNGYNVLDYMVTSYGAARQIDGRNGIFQKPIMGESAVVAEVATRTVSGTNLVLTWTDPTYDNFRNKFVISDGTTSNSQGRIIAHAPGTVTIEPTGGTAAFVAADFAVGDFASVLYEAAGNRGSEGVESLYETPFLVTNRTSITRESVELFRRDMSKSWVEYNGGAWAYAQQPIAIQRFATSLELKAIWGEQGANGVITSTLEGDVNYSMGLKEAILDVNRGGVYRPQAAVYTEQDFIEWITDIANRQANANVDLTILCGREALRTVQEFPTVITSTQFSGKQSSFNDGGRSFRGLDVMTYAIAGVNCNFIQLPAFNDNVRFPAVSTITGRNRMQYTMVALDMNSYTSVDGMQLPAAEKVYFGNKEVEHGFIAGIGVNSVPLSDSTIFDGSNPLISSQRDAIRYEIYSDCCYDFMANRMGWMELLT